MIIKEVNINFALREIKFVKKIKKTEAKNNFKKFDLSH